MSTKAQELMQLVESVVTVDDLAGMRANDAEVVDGEVSDEEFFESLGDCDLSLVDPLDEKTERVVRVRGGKVERIQKIVCPPGFRATGGKCVKMSSKELSARRRAAKKASKKAHSAGAERRRALSMKKGATLK